MALLNTMKLTQCMIKLTTKSTNLLGKILNACRDIIFKNRQFKYDIFLVVSSKL